MKRFVYILLVLYSVGQLYGQNVPVLYSGIDNDGCNIRLFIEGSSKSPYFGLYYIDGEKTKEEDFTQIALIPKPENGDAASVLVVGVGVKSSFYVREIDTIGAGPASNILFVKSDSCEIDTDFNPIVYTGLSEDYGTTGIALYHKQYDENCRAEFKISGIELFEEVNVFYYRGLDTIPVFLASFYYQDEEYDFELSSLSYGERIIASRDKNLLSSSIISNEAYIYMPDCETDGIGPDFYCNVANSLERALNFNSKSKFTIFPNPCEKIINIPFDLSEVTSIEIIDSRGAVYFRTKATNTLNTNILPVGVYMLRINYKNSKTEFHRFIKQ